MQSFTDNSQPSTAQQNNDLSHRPLWQMIVELGEEIPEEEWEKVPPDGSIMMGRWGDREIGGNSIDIYSE